MLLDICCRLSTNPQVRHLRTMRKAETKSPQCLWSRHAAIHLYAVGSQRDSPRMVPYWASVRLPKQEKLRCKITKFFVPMQEKGGNNFREWRKSRNDIHMCRSGIAIWRCRCGTCVCVLCCYYSAAISSAVRLRLLAMMSMGTPLSLKLRAFFIRSSARPLASPFFSAVVTVL